MGRALIHSLLCADTWGVGDDHGETPNARTPRPEKAKSEASGVVKKQRHPESATLFVGNLPFDATEEALRVLVESTATAVDEDSSKMPKQEDEEVQEKKGEGQENAQKSGRGGKKSGLRKVRLGAFEDTGRCKGYFNRFMTCLGLC